MKTRQENNTCARATEAASHFGNKPRNFIKALQRTLDALLVVFHTQAEKLVNLFTHLLLTEQVALPRRSVSKGELS
jgi:hypothetical protein